MGSYRIGSTPRATEAVGQRTAPERSIAEDYELGVGQMGPLFKVLGIDRKEPDMHALLQRRGTTVRAAITGLLDGLDTAQLLRAANVSETDIAAPQSRMLG
jgi:hypothetical protein